MSKIRVAIVNDCFGVSGLFKGRSDQFEWTHWKPGLVGYDMMVLTGGSDINTKLYKEEAKHCSWFNDQRDAFELQAIKEAGNDILKAGICRGAQLLNVHNGGTLWQDVNNHSGQHMARDLRSGKWLVLSSAHHQMMRPVGNFEMIAVAERATLRRAEKDELSGLHPDPEVIWFPETKSLCFQAHPEFGPNECEEYFFNLLEEKYHGNHLKAA